MGYAFYSDESGTSKYEKCYTIGAILVPEELRTHFSLFLSDLIEKHKIRTEIKWEKISTSYNMMNFAVDLLKEMQNMPYIFTCIVVLKSAYMKWHKNEEDAFYTTYSLLLEHCTKNLEDVISAKIDGKSDSYPKQHEVVEVIVNHKLKNQIGSINNVTKADSKESLELQAADILTGAVNSGHHLYLDNNLQIHPGKLLLLDRMSKMLGWDALHYDTYPNTDFNIWHFPMEEYRAVPETREIVPNKNVPNITLEDLKNNGI